MNIKLIYIVLSMIPICTMAADRESQAPLSQLEIVKASLLDAALGGEVSVVSNAYLNNKGELIESTYFSSNTKVKGIRIANYFNNDNQPKNIQININDLGNNCEDIPLNKYKKNLSVRISNKSNNTSAGNLIKLFEADLYKYLDENIENIELQNTFINVDRNNYTSNVNSYYQYLAPRDSDKKNDYLFIINIENIKKSENIPLKTIQGGYKTAKNITKYAAKELGLASIPSDAISSRAIYSISANVILENSASSGVKERLYEKKIAFLYDPDKKEIRIESNIFDEIKNKVTELVGLNRQKTVISDHISQNLLQEPLDLLECSSNEYQASREGSFYTISVNSNAGINVGDRFLLNTQRLNTLGASIDSESLNELAIAEIISTDSNSATLEIVEGAISRNNVLAIPF